MADVSTGVAVSVDEPESEVEVGAVVWSAEAVAVVSTVADV